MRNNSVWPKIGLGAERPIPLWKSLILTTSWGLTYGQGWPNLPAQCSVSGAPTPLPHLHQRLPSAPNSALPLCLHSFQGVCRHSQSKNIIGHNVKYANVYKYFYLVKKLSYIVVLDHFTWKWKIILHYFSWYLAWLWACQFLKFLWRIPNE